MNQHLLSQLRKTCALTLTILLTSTNLTWAAPPPTRTEIEDQNRKARQEQEARQQREQTPDVFLQKGKQSTDDLKLPEETPSFLITTIKIAGDDQGNFPWLQERASLYQGQNIGWQGINAIVKNLTNVCIDRGYVTTRVLIPQQDISTGILTLQLVPGTIQDIRIADPTIRADWKSAFPTRPGHILNLRDLEQGLEQMKRVPSQDASMQLLPGDKPGESIVEITVKQTKPWKLVTSLDDSGSKATGKLQVSETFALDNLFGVNDLFNLSLNKDAEKNNTQYGTKGNSFSYSVPNGYWTYSLSSSVYKYHQTIPNLGNNLIYSGRTRNIELKAEKLLHRVQTRKTHLAFSVIKSKSKSFIEDAELEMQRRNTTAAKLSLSHKQYNGQTVVDYNLAYKRGVPWLGATQNPGDNEPGQPTTKYNLWTFDTSITTPVTLGKTKAQYNLTLHGQYTKDMLYASEFLSIGNRYTVRGFDGEQTLSAENGFYLRNELSIPLNQSGPEVYIGLDLGRISGPSANPDTGKSLAGTTMGLRGSVGSAQYDLFIGTPLKHPAGIQVPSHVYGFQLVYQI